MVVKRPNAENIDNYMVIQNALSAGNIKSIDVSFLYYDDYLKLMFHICR